jgi:hypothetical protein
MEADNYKRFLNISQSASGGLTPDGKVLNLKEVLITTND